MMMMHGEFRKSVVGRAALALLALCVALGALLGPAPARAAGGPGTWESRPGLGPARADSAAVQLPDGKILVTGGFDGAAILKSVRRYDPKANTWADADPMKSARRGHTATLLADGRVLVVGGSNGAFDLASAEVFDPATGTWAYGPAHLATGRSRHTATRLADGRVLIVGGVLGGAYLGSAELYDPAAGPNSTALPAGQLGPGRVEHTATLLADGRVLVVGGAVGVNAPTNAAALYTPGTNGWSVAPALPQPRVGHAATPLKDGRVLLTGGSNGVATLASALFYTPVAGQPGGWSEAPPLPEARAWHSATAIPTGEVLIAGGLGAGGATLNSASLYVPVAGPAGGWIATGALVGPRARHTTFVSPTRRGGHYRVLAIGGTPAGGSAPTEDYGVPGVLVLSVATDGPGTVAATAGPIYIEGADPTLTAIPNAGAVFLGWDASAGGASASLGWQPTLTLSSSGNFPAIAIRAHFAARPTFTDVPANSGYAEAIGQLAARGIVKGYGDGQFGPNDPVLRAQMAALIARAMGWDAEDWGNGFPDRGGVDDALWCNVGTLAHYGVAKGYGDGTYGPTDDVLQAQTISFITRAMIAKGYWTAQPDDPTLVPNVPAASGHRQDLATFVHYTGDLLGADAHAAWPDWDHPAARGWFALALWRALDGHFTGNEPNDPPVILAPHP